VSVVFAAVQIRSAFQSRIDDRDADALSSRSVVAHSIESKRFEQSTRSDLTGLTDYCIGRHDGIS
jgi:hypothetical protein